MDQKKQAPQLAADAGILLDKANRVMALRRAEPFDGELFRTMKLDLSPFLSPERQDGSLDLDTLLTQRRRLRLLAGARRRGELDGLDSETRARCETLLELAPAYHRCVRCVLAMHSLFYGDEGGMELLEGDFRRESLRQELRTCLKQLNDIIKAQGEKHSPAAGKEQPMFRDPFDFNNDGKVDAEEEFLGFMMMERSLRDAEEDGEELFDDEENDLI